MDRQPSVHSNPEIIALLDHWRSLRSKGISITPEELCRNAPHLLEEIEKRISTLHDSDVSFHSASTVTKPARSLPAIADANRESDSRPLEETSMYVPTAGDGKPLGACIGPYRVLERVSHGGMGVVYRVHDPRLGRVVALKTIRSDAFTGSEVVERFSIEARAMARMNHRNVLAVHDIGVFENRPYYVMDFAEGGSLADRLGDLQANPRQGLSMLIRVALGVQYAHDQEIVHRDLKPSNVLIDNDGEPLVGDFGLAKIIDHEIRMTTAGQVMGSPAYMAPEQARGDLSQIGKQSDVWALGVMLYELLTGHLPFRGRTREEVLFKITSTSARTPRELRPLMHPRLAEIVVRCLEPHPADRFPSCRELAEALQGCLARDEVFINERGWRNRLNESLKRAGKRPWAAGVLCLSILIALTTLIPGYSSSGPGSVSMEEEGAVRLTVTPQLPVALVGAGGTAPLGARWLPTGDNARRAHDAKENCLTIQCRGETGLLLIPRVPWPDYRFEAQVRHDDGPKGKAGIFFAQDRVHKQPPFGLRFYDFLFTDHAPGKSLVKCAFQLNDSAHSATIDLGIRTINKDVGAGADAPPWRSLAIEVRSNVVSFEWEGKRFGSLTHQRARDHLTRYDRQLAAESVADFQGGLGLIVRYGSASFLT